MRCFRPDSPYPAAVGTAKRKTVPRPVPRTWLAEPSATPDPWRSAKPVWKSASTDFERALLAAAQDQHRVTFYLRRYRDAEGKLNADIAKIVGRHTDQVSAILRGGAHVSMADLHLIAAAVKARIDTVPKPTRNPDPHRRR